MKNKIALALTAIVLLAMPLTAHAEWKPTKPVSIMCPYGPGGTCGFIANSIKDALSKELGVPVLLEHTKGAGGTIGTTQIAKGKADGHRLLIGTPSNMSFNYVFMKDPGYDSPNDFAGVTVVGDMAKVLVVNADSKYNTFQDLLADIKNRPNKVKAGVLLNTNDMVYSIVWTKQANAQVKRVVYNSGGEYMPDILAGRVDFVHGNIPEFKPYILSGKLKLLAVSSPERLKDFPDVPTWKELGFEDVNTPTWYAFMVQKKTPKDRINVLNKAITNAIKNTPTLKAGLESRDINLLYSTPDFASDRIVTTTALAKKMGKIAGIDPK